MGGGNVSTGPKISSDRGGDNGLNRASGGNRLTKNWEENAKDPMKKKGVVYKAK